MHEQLINIEQSHNPTTSSNERSLLRFPHYFLICVEADLVYTFRAVLGSKTAPTLTISGECK